LDDGIALELTSKYHRTACRCLPILVSRAPLQEEGKGERAQPRRQKIPIVFITAHGDENVRPLVLAQGAVECPFKSYGEDAMLDALTLALRVA